MRPAELALNGSANTLLNGVELQHELSPRSVRDGDEGGGRGGIARGDTRCCDDKRVGEIRCMSEIASKFKRLLERFLGCLVPPKRVRGQTKVESGGQDARAVAHLAAQATTLVRERESHLEFPQLESEICP